MYYLFWTIVEYNVLGFIFGSMILVCTSDVFLWTQFAFDATLGFPGEGPCSLCGDTSHNIRTCPFVPADAGSVSSSSIQDLPAGRNTFVHFEQTVPQRARNLRGHSSEGDTTSSPPSQLRRLNEEGEAVPGSQHLEDDEMQAGSQDSVLAQQASDHLSISDQHGSSAVAAAANSSSSSGSRTSDRMRCYCPVLWVLVWRSTQNSRMGFSIGYAFSFGRTCLRTISW